MRTRKKICNCKILTQSSLTEVLTHQKTGCMKVSKKEEEENHGEMVMKKARHAEKEKYGAYIEKDVETMSWRE